MGRYQEVTIGQKRRMILTATKENLERIKFDNELPDKRIGVFSRGVYLKSLSLHASLIKFDLIALRFLINDIKSIARDGYVQKIPIPGEK